MARIGLERLKRPEAWPAELLIVWTVCRGIIESVSSIDTIKAHVDQLKEIFQFIVSPAGNLASFALGLTWLGYVVLRKKDAKPAPSELSAEGTAHRVIITSGADEYESKILDVQHEWDQLTRLYGEIVEAWNKIQHTRPTELKDEEMKAQAERLLTALERWKDRLLTVGHQIIVERDE